MNPPAMQAVSDSMVYGMMGITFLVSLLLPQHHASSTVAGENKNGAI
ncbi:hypothetical protein PQR66_26995 [Paraburkholderia agricolaris]|uniref:Uncharacterized protein n=1 Tax=Paraburkholderia agricolaris TaxID=2152888 RepID=A0ABW8ZV45_9BURK